MKKLPTRARPNLIALEPRILFDAAIPATLDAVDKNSDKGNKGGDKGSTTDNTTTPPAGSGTTDTSTTTSGSGTDNTNNSTTPTDQAAGAGKSDEEKNDNNVSGQLGDQGNNDTKNDTKGNAGGGAGNTAPDAVNDTYNTDYETAITFDVLANDTDANGDSLTITDYTQPAVGSLTFENGVFTYTPAAGYSGTVSFTYTITDGTANPNNNKDTATVTITVGEAPPPPPPPPNEGPDAITDRVVTDYETPVTIDVLANDRDPENDPLTIISWTQPANGTVSLVDGRFVYTPDPGFHEADSFTYTIRDPAGNEDTATVGIAVKNQNNDGPDVQDDYANTAYETSVIIDVLANDSDKDDFEIIDFTQPTQGTVELINGQFKYTPPAGFSGTVTFTYTVKDIREDDDGDRDDDEYDHDDPETATATVYITVGEQPNGGPDAVNDSASTDYETPVFITVLDNDQDPDQDTLTITDFTQPAAGTVELIDGQFKYTPAAGYSGTTTFTYTITDSKGETDTATVTITVGEAPPPPPNEGPDAITDRVVTDYETPVTIDVLANDRDPENDVLTIVSWTQPSNGTVELVDGRFVYTPDPGFHEADSFTYTIRDAAGNEDTATVGIAVRNERNDGPDVQDDYATTPYETAVTVDVLANDSDDDDFEIIDFTQPSQGTVELVNGQFVYTPPEGFSGTVTFTYTVKDIREDDDGDRDDDDSDHDDPKTATATVYITVGERPNGDPDAVNDSASTDYETPVTIDVLANDQDPDQDTLTITDFMQPASGAVELVNGQFVYTPPLGFSGTVTFTYTVSDQQGRTDTATVTVTVGEKPNDPPVANDDSVTTAYETPVTINVVTNDSDLDQDPIEIDSFTQPANGRVELVDGKLVYTPNELFSGKDTFTYTIVDDDGETDTATVTITVRAKPNSAPDATNDSASTDYETPVTVNVLGNDTDPDQDGLEITDFTQPASGTVELVNGQFVYTPAAGFSGVVSFTYTIRDIRANGSDQDDEHKPKTSTATVTITVGEKPNDPPVAQDDPATTDYETPVVIDVLGNDSDPDQDPITIDSFTQPANGSVELVNGKLVYTPPAGFSGVATFTYTITDDDGVTSTATVTVTVGEKPNDPPSAQDDTVDTPYETPVVIDVTGNDTDPDQDPVEIDSFTQPVNGTVELIDGKLVYTPPAGFSGVATFTYTITDDDGETSTATVTITVGEKPNDPPVAQDDPATTNYETPVVIDVLGNDSDPDQDPVVIDSFTQPANGSVSLVDGKLVYTPPAGFSGTTTFTYTITDDDGVTSTAAVTVTVGEKPNDPPVAQDDPASTEYETPVVIDVLGNDSDPDQDPVVIDSFTQPVDGTVELVNGKLVYTPPAGFSGVATFTYTIIDDDGELSTATVTVTIGEKPNDPPLAQDDLVTTAYETPIAINVVGNDSDPDQDPINIFSFTQPANGQVELVDGKLVYTPPAGFSGTTTFTYTIVDDDGEVSTATVTVEVAEKPNTPPEATDDTYATDYETPVVLDILANDSDPDQERITVVGISTPVGGTLGIVNGQLVFTPAAGFSGTATFSYTIRDARGLESTASVNITVAAAPPPPPEPPPPEPPTDPEPPPPEPEPEPEPTPVVIVAPQPTPTIVTTTTVTPVVSTVVFTPIAQPSVSFPDSFRSTIFSLNSLTLAMPAAFTAPLPGVDSGLFVLKPPEPVTVGENRAVDVRLPPDTFASTNANAKIDVVARTADGGALPQGITFDPVTGRISGTLPPGVNVLVITIEATDSDGNKATAQVTIRAGEVTAKIMPGKPSLTEQLKLAIKKMKLQLLA